MVDVENHQFFRLVAEDWVVPGVHEMRDREL